MGDEAGGKGSLGRGGNMTAQGVDFLNAWTKENISPLHTKGDVLIRALAQKLRDEAASAGFTIEDLEVEGSKVEQYIRQTLVHLAESGPLAD